MRSDTSHTHGRGPRAAIAVAFLAMMSGPGAVSAQSPSLGPVPTSGMPVDRIISDDGRLTLFVPVGGKPDVSGLSIVSVPVGVPAVAAYELRPLDTSFPVPVTASWQLDPTGAPPATNGDLIWLGMARASDIVGGPGEWLGDPQVVVVDGRYSVTGQLTRFGTLVVAQLPTLIRGPEAIWGPGYAPGRGIPVDLDLTLVTAVGDRGTAAFSGDWRFGGGYPDRIGVTTTIAAADRLAAVWQCQRTGATSLATTFGVTEYVADPGTTRSPLDLGPAAAGFSVTFPVACGTQHPGTNG